MKSRTATLTVLPEITFPFQPQNAVTSPGVSATFTVIAQTTDTRYTLEYQWEVDGVFQAGATSPTFVYSTPFAGSYEVRCFVFQIVPSTAVTEFGDTIFIQNEASAFSDVAILEVADPRPILRFEGFTPDGGYKVVDANLDEGEFLLDSSVFDSSYNVITYYAREKTFDLEMVIDGAPGKSIAAGVVGAQGGRSRVSLTHEKDVEHTVLGVTNNSAVFVYKGSELTLACGQGGDSADRASTGPAGMGGGVNVAGGTATVVISGTTIQQGIPIFSPQLTGTSEGGALIPAGGLSLNGVFGSILSGQIPAAYLPFTGPQTTGNEPALQPGDSVAPINKGGRTISCSKGTYWLNQGISPCANNGLSPVKFVTAAGDTVEESDSIIRGFKPGYTITTTAGRGTIGAPFPAVAPGLQVWIAMGGNGATGGDGGIGGNAGSGGSGYTNGAATILETQLGGVPINETSKIRFSIPSGPPPPTTGTVTHAFDDINNITTFLSFDGVMSTIEVINPTAPNTFNDTSLNAKYYLLTLNDDYTNLTVFVLQDVTAEGGAGAGLIPSRIQKRPNRQWGVWFARGDGQSAYARNWSVSAT